MYKIIFSLSYIMSEYNQFVKTMMPQLEGTPQQKMKTIGQLWRQEGQGQGRHLTPKLRGGAVRKTPKKTGKKMKPAMKQRTTTRKTIRGGAMSDEDIFNKVFEKELKGGSMALRGGSTVSLRGGSTKKQPTKNNLVVLNNGMIMDMNDLNEIYGMHGMQGGKAFKNTKFGHFLYGIGDALKSKQFTDTLLKVAPIALAAL